MNLESLLSQLKKDITPGGEYVARSRMALLAHERPTVVRGPVWRFFLQGFHAGSAIVLAGILFVLVFGGFSLVKLLTPFRIAALDPSSIRAEAKAIDIQIQLADLNYQESPAPAAGRTTTPKTFATPNPVISEIKKEARAQAKTLGLPATELATSTPSSSEPLSVDQALLKLSEE